MLIEKCRILITGYGKRGKTQDEKYYRDLASRYSNLVEEPER